MTTLKLDRMRKYAAGRPAPKGAAAVTGALAGEYPAGSTVIRDAVGRVIRVIEPRRG
jgi:hypothetical protein